MNDTSIRIDKIHARSEAIERIGECRGLCSLHIKHFADKNRAANMGDDQPHPTPRLVIGDAVALMTQNPEYGDACRRFVEGSPHEIDQALRPHPFPIKSRFLEFMTRHQIRDRKGLLELS